MKRFLSLIILLASSAQFAAAEASHGEAHSAGHHEVSLTWPWVNFLIYVVGLFFILRRPFSEMWDARRRNLADLRERGALELRTAQGLLQDAEKKIRNLEQEATEMEKSIVVDGEKEGAQLVLDAKARAQRIAAQVDESISSELRGAEVSLRRELADKVLTSASEKLKRELNADSDRAIRQQVLGGVRGLMQ